MHPTVKPVAMVADALRDCSKRNQIVLDPFAGSGTTLIAAQKTGRRAYLLELDPLYCDTIIRRWQAYTGKRARHADTGRDFEELEELRVAEAGVAEVTPAKCGNSLSAENHGDAESDAEATAQTHFILYGHFPETHSTD